jgi:hypothetical protein
MQKTANYDVAHADPNGFYHGMGMRHAGSEFVPCGPPVAFIPSESELHSLS